MSGKVALYRRQLRHTILANYQGVPSEAIYKDLKNPDLPSLFVQDLIPFCEELGIPERDLPAILAPYGIATNRISPDKLKKFLEDEVTCKTEESPLKSRVNDSQDKILTTFSNALRTRKTQADSTGTVQMSSIWIYLVRMNPPGASDKFVRLATLCKLVDEYNLSFSVESFIDAVFSFFGEKIDQLDYSQFASMIRSFS